MAIATIDDTIDDISLDTTLRTHSVQPCPICLNTRLHIMFYIRHPETLLQIILVYT